MRKINKIIVEGADQQGKSSLCAFLREQLGWNIKHFGSPRPHFNFMDHYFVDDKTICDRNFLSEIVYSKLRGGKSCRITNLPAIENFFSDAILILCDRGDKFIFDDRDELFSHQQILTAREHYRVAYSSLKLPKMIYNPHHKESNSEICKLIMQIRNQYESTEKTTY